MLPSIISIIDIMTASAVELNLPKFKTSTAVLLGTTQLKWREVFLGGGGSQSFDTSVLSTFRK